jgi:uncharacterized protein
MLKNSLLPLCFLITVSNLFSQEKESPSTNSLLWKISRHDLSFESYLFGTNHFVESKFIDTSVALKNLLASVRAVTVEIDLDDIDSTVLLNSIFMKSNEKYEFQNTEDEVMVNEYITELTGGTDYKFFYKLKPLLLSVFLQTLHMKKLGLDVTGKGFESIDDWFFHKAKALSKGIESLETPEEQAAMLSDSISIKRQMEMLMYFVKSVKSQGAYFMIMDSCYKSGNLDCIEQFLTTSSYFNEKENMMFIYNRNKEWMKQIPPLINYKPILIAVGVGHLVGNDGLINLLKRAGYNVQPIRF